MTCKHKMLIQKPLKHLTCFIALLGGSAVAFAAVAQEASKQDTQCNVGVIQSFADSDTTIVSAQTQTLPALHCRIDGYVTTTNPGPNKVNFALQLPVKQAWNNRFYFIGLGGSGGHVPTESQYPSGNPITKGFAVAGTDKGHQGSSSDWSFANDPAKALDDAHRGAHVTTIAAQRLTKGYYGAQKMYRYHSGCSGGGQMGIQAMQIYPQDYDGVLLGWPGGRPADPNKVGVVDHAVFVREMTRERGSWVSPDKLNFVQERVLERCDITDGAKDGTVWDARLCNLDVASLQCKNGDGANCLTKPEIKSIKNILRETSAPLTNIAGWTWYLGRVPPPWSFDPKANPRETIRHSSLSYVLVNGWAREILKQPDRDIVKTPLTKKEMWTILEARAARAGTVPYGKVGLEDYARAGGKAIFYVGEGDIGSSSQAQEQYFLDMNEKVGAQSVDAMAKLYTVPAWGHCSGTQGPIDAADHLLEALINWVERGSEPAAVETHRGADDRINLAFQSLEDLRKKLKQEGFAEVAGDPAGIKPARDFLLCPFPLVSIFNKDKASLNEDAVYDAQYWRCGTVADRQKVIGN